MSKARLNILVWSVWYGALTLVLMPWRNSFSQDDSVYFKFAQSVASGQFEVHALNVAGVWPQALIGGLILKLPLPPIPSLNLLTWLLFGVLSLVLCLKFERPYQTLAFFSFPMWVQYGISFLPDIYLLITLVGVYFWFKENWPKWLILPLVAALFCQYQSTIAFVFFWSLFLILRKNRKGWLGLSAVFFAFFVFSLLPKSEMQQLGLNLYLQRVNGLSLGDIAEMLLKSLQLFLCIGIFLWPMIRIPRVSVGILLLFLHGLFAIMFYYFSADIISAGVLFTNYFPKILGSIFVSSGVWGWYALWSTPTLNPWRNPLILGVLFATATINIFDGFRGVQDFRYVLPSALLIFIFLLEIDFSEKAYFIWRDKIRRFGVLTLAGLGCLLVNSYNLETTQARWGAAGDVIRGGVSSQFLSAGYGWDLMNYEPECIKKVIQKIQMSSVDKQDLMLRTRLLLKVPRAYEDDAIPQVLIKPHSFLGQRLSLTRNLRSGQHNEPERIISYSVLGLPAELAVMNNEISRPPWCFRVGTTDQD